MIVAIVEKHTGRTVGQYPVILQGQNYQASDAEHFELAWKCAVDDKLVKATDRDKYEFRCAG